MDQSSEIIGSGKLTNSDTSAGKSDERSSDQTSVGSPVVKTDQGISHGKSRATPLDQYQFPTSNSITDSNPARDLLGIRSHLGGGETPEGLLLSPCYMIETHGGGGFERVPGFDVSRAMESVISPVGSTARTPRNQFIGMSPARESAIGTRDTRAPVPNTSLLPWRCIARLEIAFASGARGTGSGWFISPRTLATAGHNFWDQEHGRARDIRIFPGYSQGYPAFGSYRATEAFWDPQWPNGFDERRDFALLHIDSDPRVGYFGYAAASDDGLQNVASCVNVAGYPSDKDGGQQYYDAGTQYYDGGRIVGADEYFIYHTIDTNVGQSGGPLFWSDEANRIGLGIHVYGTDPRHPSNRALRITKDLYEIFSAYKR